MSSPFFYRSFVRQFAEQLKLDYDALAPAVQSAADTIPKPLMPGEAIPGHEAELHPKVPALRVPRRRDARRWLSSFVSLGLMLIGFSGLYALWQNRAAVVHHFRPSPPSVPPLRAATPAAKPAPVIPQTPVAPPIEPDSAFRPDGAFRVELSALERTWLSIVADGRRTFSGILQPAETKTLEGHDTASIRTGNAGGITLVFNGKPIGTPGPRGTVRTIVFTKNNFEVLETPQHLALSLLTLSGE